MKYEFPNAETETKAKHYRINAFEYHRITELLGHQPQGIEWALFSALWSEHCSYKSSKVHLRKFAYRNASVLEAEGENAGVVDLGQGERVAFKMESHNHPSFIEPYQGAATGVGGILRDIFTMGARPIALADYLCFGEPHADRMKTLVKGVVAGISGYGNCVGVPNVTGATEFDASYNKNILVNAMAVGLFRKDDPMALSKAKGPGNWVVYVGAKTGRDGVHGASMASESFDDKSDAKKPNVQIGDPFFEKLLIEACLEILKENLVVAMQDMGAAGLTSSSFEMSSKGGVGMEMNLDQVPMRDSTLNPEEILLSESQERMLLVCEPAKFPRIQAVFARWGLDATRIGTILPEKKVKLRWHGETLCEIDPDLLVENAPKYEREYSAWKPKHKVSKVAFESTQNIAQLLPRLNLDPRLSAKNWVYDQYDQRVGARTARDASQTVAFVRLPDSGRGLAVMTGCRPHLMRLDAQLGAYEAVFGPALQMAIKGAKILAVTDCLNFGNPERNEIMSEFVASVEAIAEAAKALDAPVISGNVSFYNETLGRNITSTPATGMVGLRESVEHIPYDGFKNEGESVLLVRLPMVSCLSRVAEICGQPKQQAGTFDVAKATSFVNLARQIAMDFKPSATRMVFEGGLVTALSRMTAAFGVGFKANDELAQWSRDQMITENLLEFAIAIPAGQALALKSLVRKEGFEAIELGVTHKNALDLGATHGSFSVSSVQHACTQGWVQTFGEL